MRNLQTSRDRNCGRDYASNFTNYKVHISNRRRRQSGYLLLSLLIMAAIMVIASAAIAPRVAQEIKRQREAELIHRGTEYARAIKRYYKKFGRYPTSLDQLENTNNIRFLRKRYTDPITGKDQWRLIHFGEAKVTPNMFGANAAGGQAALAGATPAAAMPGASGQSPTSTFGSSSFGSSSFGSSSSSFGSTAGTSTSGSNQSGIGTPASQMSSSSGNNPTFGGGPIVGVSSTSEKTSLKELNGKTHYNEWEFVYDPRLDRQTALGAGAVGQPGQLNQQGTFGPQMNQQPGSFGTQPSPSPQPTVPH
jgi:type II secretory pathway pseudopilin PulG